MARRKQTRGKCAFCGREMTRGGLARHLPACPQRQEAIATADQKTGQDQTLYHLQVQDAWQGDFWLHLEMNGAAARLVTIGDRLIIMAFSELDSPPPPDWQPRILILDDRNRVKSQKGELTDAADH